MAFFNWLYARSRRGAFILRIEDTDRSRSTQEYERAILEDFRWLGLDWDEGPDVGGPVGPYRQTERGPLYRQYARALVDSGAAYYCYCTPQELQADRDAARRQGRPYRYSGRCRHLTAAERARREADGRRPTIRLRVPDTGGPIVVTDLIRGPVAFDPASLDDPIVVRSDGTPLYNFANVVDDHLMQITHVIRGSEHLSNTPIQWLIYQALGWTPPAFAHLPVILGPDRRKLSKRLAATALREYRRDGYLPEALLNFFALMAWHPDPEREVYAVSELVERFRLEDLGRASPVFDHAKLTWLNGLYMRELMHRDPQRVVGICLEVLREAGLVGEESPEVRAYVAAVVAVLGDRLKVGRDILAYGDFFFTDQVRYDPQAVQEHLQGAEAVRILSALRDRIARVAVLDRHSAESVVRGLAGEWGIHAREVIHRTRVALTGKTVGPGLFELMEVLGRDRVVARLDRAVAWLQAAGTRP
jgi:glutamyl-tRNA synthetase